MLDELVIVDVIFLILKSFWIQIDSRMFALQLYCNCTSSAEPMFNLYV